MLNLIMSVNMILVFSSIMSAVMGMIVVADIFE